MTVIYPQQQAASPVVVVPAYPALQDNQPANSGGLSEIRDQSPLYLIALQDHAIRAALAYWVDDGTVHYIDLDHKVQELPLSTVDRDLSLRLNRERRVPFHLP